MRTYAIGDIHGQLEKLVEVHRLIAEDSADRREAAAQIVHVGDLVDRGPDSRGVIDYLMKGMAEGKPWVVLKGNHDRMFRDFMRDPDSHDPGLRADLHWIDPRLGGNTTLASYGVDTEGQVLLHDLHKEAQARVPGAHMEFIDGLPTLHRADGAVFVHAGIRPGVALDLQVEDDLVWIRRGFLDDTRNHGFLVVHGHTPEEDVTHHGNRLNIDTGAGYGRKLSAVVIEDSTIWQLGPDGRVPVRPAP